MTEDPGPTYQQMKDALQQATEALDIAERRVVDANNRADKNHLNGDAWKKQAEELTKQLNRAVTAAEQAQAEAAELRGYIKRVHETDGEGVKHFDIGFGPRPVDYPGFYDTAFEQARRR